MSCYVVYDLEMCPVPKGERREAFGARQELIQIGAVLLSDTYEPTDRFMTFVAPRFGTVDPFITKLTGITPAMTADAPATEEALLRFQNWIPEDAIMVSWSRSDEHQIYHEIDGKAIDLPRLEDLLYDSIDCQQEFTERLHRSNPYSLSEALSIAGIDCDDDIHDALTDAHNTALLFAKLKTETTLHMSPYYLSEEDMQAHRAGE